MVMQMPHPVEVNAQIAERINSAYDPQAKQYIRDLHKKVMRGVMSDRKKREIERARIGPTPAPTYAPNIDIMTFPGAPGSKAGPALKSNSRQVKGHTSSQGMERLRFMSRLEVSHGVRGNGEAEIEIGGLFEREEAERRATRARRRYLDEKPVKLHSEKELHQRNMEMAILEAHGHSKYELGRDYIPDKPIVYDSERQKFSVESDSWNSEIESDLAYTSDWQCPVCNEPWEYVYGWCRFCGEERLKKGEGPRYDLDPYPYPHGNPAWHADAAVSLLNRILDQNFTDFDMSIPNLPKQIIVSKTCVRLGACGVGYMYLRLAAHPWFQEERGLLLQEAADLISYGQDLWATVAYDESMMSEYGAGLWDGLAGRVYVETIFHLETGDFVEAEACMETLISMARFVSTDMCSQDTYHDGRAGFLFALTDLLFRTTHRKEENTSKQIQSCTKGLGVPPTSSESSKHRSRDVEMLESAIEKVARKILDRGKEFVWDYSIELTPLIWPANKDMHMFLGLERGTMGCLHALLHVPPSILDRADPEWRHDINQTLQFVLMHQVYTDPAYTNATAYPEAAKPGIEQPLPAIKFHDATSSILKDGGGIGEIYRAGEEEEMPPQFHRFGFEADELPPEQTVNRTYQNLGEGSGGAVFLFLQARRVLGDPGDTFLNAARKAGDAVWERGLIRQGMGIIKGVSGNAYAFLALARAEEDEDKSNLWIQRARLFGAFMVNWETELPKPMRKLSLEFSRTAWYETSVPGCLMEGYGSGVLLLVDLEDPKNARAPLVEPTLWPHVFPRSTAPRLAQMEPRLVPPRASRRN
ncbi:hypothetical protein AAMO2058_000427000 [Amorphochlora amoebiformis]